MISKGEFLKCKKVSRMQDIVDTYPWMEKGEAVRFNKELKAGTIFYVPLFISEEEKVTWINGIQNTAGFMITDCGGRWYSAPFRPIMDTCGTLWFDSVIFNMKEL